MFRSLYLILGLTLGGLAVATTGLAQTTGEMTEAEIAAAFAKQKTRGLSIAPALDAAAPAPASSDATAAQPAEGTTVAYEQVPQDEQVNIAISFDFDSSALRADQKPKLAALCNVMKASDIPVFRIVGHTDSSGSAAYNENLSLLRAQEVKRYLATDCGIADDKMQAVGVGAQFPFDTSNPRADVNRRVEFQALS